MSRLSTCDEEYDECDSRDRHEPSKSTESAWGGRIEGINGFAPSSLGDTPLGARYVCGVSMPNAETEFQLATKMGINCCIEQTPMRPVFESQRRAAQWLGSRLIGLLLVGVLAVLFATSDDYNPFSLVVTVAMLLLVFVQLKTQPPMSTPRWRGERALAMAAGNKLGLNGSLVWMIDDVLSVAIGLGFLLAIILRWT